jgi:hypothetical protein
MDAGLAAVLGALAGSVATIGAAIATGWAQREGARITARSEHRRERREPRHDLYKEFISKANLIKHQAGTYVALEDGLTPDYVDEDQARFMLDSSSEIEKKATEVALAGPKKVTEAVLSIARLSNELAITVYSFRSWAESRHERIREHQRKKIIALSLDYESSLADFILRAQSALDDDGSLK